MYKRQTWVAAGKEIDHVERITAAEFAHGFRKNGEPVFDVRKHSEFDAQHVEGVVNIPLNQINKFLSAFPKNAPFVLHCAAGYRLSLIHI